MGELAEAWREVERLKLEPWDPPAALVEMISASVRQEFGRPATSVELKTALDGVGLTARVAERYELDWDEMYEIAHAIAETAVVKMRRIHGREAVEAGNIEVGVGAGFFTGLWTGLLLGERRG